MPHADGVARASIVEYGAPRQLIHSIASALNTDVDQVRGQLLLAGERVARSLSLPANPVGITELGMRVVNVAGLLRAGPRFELEIAPKFLGLAWPTWREDFFFIAMLSRHGRLYATDRLRATTGSRGDLATLVARAMAVMFWDNHRRPLRTYRLKEVEDFAIDGDVDPESIVLPPVDGYRQMLVSYDRQNVYNAAILAATQVLLAEVRDPETRQTLVRVVQALAPQGRIRVPRQRRVPSRARRWQPLHDLAIDILKGFGVAYAADSVAAPGFVVDTWRVWEDLVTIGLRMGFGSENVRAQRSLTLGVRTSIGASGVVSKDAFVTPDILSHSSNGLIVDAKYKGRLGDQSNRIGESDLYEALAFASAAKRSRVMLLYPAIARGEAAETGATRVFERITVDDVSVVGADVEVRGISRIGALGKFATNMRAGCEAVLAGHDVPTLGSSSGTKPDYEYAPTMPRLRVAAERPPRSSDYDS